MSKRTVAILCGLPALFAIAGGLFFLLEAWRTANVGFGLVAVTLFLAAVVLIGRMLWHFADCDRRPVRAAGDARARRRVS